MPIKEMIYASTDDHASIIYLFALPPSVVAEPRPEHRPKTLSWVRIL